MLHWATPYLRISVTSHHSHRGSRSALLAIQGQLFISDLVLETPTAVRTNNLPDNLQVPILRLFPRDSPQFPAIPYTVVLYRTLCGGCTCHSELVAQLGPHSALLW